MDALTPLVVQAIAGLLGGGIAGNLFDVAAIRTPPKVLLGVLGGIVIGGLAGLALGVGSAATVVPDSSVAADAVSHVNFAALGAWVSGGLIGGALFTTVSGALGIGR